MQKNVITKLAKLLVHGEAGKGSTIHIDAAGDKGLKYEVVKKVVAHPQEVKDVALRRPMKKRKGFA